MHKVYLVIDDYGWVQEKRAKQFIKLEKNRGIIYKVINFDYFKNNIKKFKNENCLFYLMSWRILDGYNLNNLLNIKNKIIIGITSHYNIGGIKYKSKCLSNSKPYKTTLKNTYSTLNFFKYFTVNSKILEKTVKKKLRGKVFYTPNGVDHKYFNKKGIHFTKEINIGWAGKIKAAKNFELIERINKKYSKEMNFIYKISNRNFSFLDKLKLKKNKMNNFYNEINFYLCTSWHEGTPNPCLEALSCGIPVITTKVGNMPELIKNKSNGFFIEPNIKSFESVINKIKKFNKQNYTTMSSNARKSVLKNWTWEKKYIEIRKMFFSVKERI